MMKLKNRTLLVVEDEDSLRANIQESLRRAGATVLVAANGREAWKLLQIHRFDAVVSDLKMPIVDGMELLRMIQNAGLHVPFIFLTGFANEIYGEMYKAGARAIVSKPFEIKHLGRVICEVLDADLPEQLRAPRNNPS